MELTAADLKLAIDTVWTLLAGCLVFWMGTGFAMLEAGLARTKHTVNVLAMNYGVLAVSGLAFWAIGFGVTFGGGNAFLGLSGFFPDFVGEPTAFSSLSWSGIPLGAKFFFHLAFADAAASIVSGIVAERMKFSAYMLFSIILVALIYPIAGHWGWGGGFLSTLAVPFQDFAGSTFVHSVGGWCCLTGTIILGPRIGKFLKDGTARSFPAHNLSLATLGTLILWMGWFGFNAGSTMAADPRAISHIVATTMLGASAGMTSALLLSYWFRKNADLGTLLNGTLAGLVAITAGCNAVSMGGSVIIGLISGVLCYFAGPFFDRMRVDDPVGALSVHLVNGVFGTLAVGLFATKAGSVGSYDGLFYGGGFALLQTQLIGIAAVAAFTITASTAAWYAIGAVLGGLRVPASVELKGLDMHQHGAIAYHDEPETEDTDRFSPQSPIMNA